MKYLLPILFFFSIFQLHGGDHRFGGTKRQRIEEMRSYFTNEDHKKKTLWEWKYMTGHWNGYRKRLVDNGITLSSNFVTNSLGNPCGGKGQGFTYTGSLGADVVFDLEKLCCAKGLEFYVSVVWRTGSSLSKKYIDNQFPVQQIFGNQVLLLNEVYFEQKLCDGKVIFKAGRLDEGNDFLQNNLYYYYVNNAFCGNPISVFFNGYFSAYPNASWAAVLKLLPTKRTYMHFGIFNGNLKAFNSHYHGMNFSFKNTDGVQYITEWGIKFNQLPCDTGLPGNIDIGAYYLTGKKQKFNGCQVKGNYAFYIEMDKMIHRFGCQGSDRGISPFAAFVFAPKDRALFPFFFTSGIVCKGWNSCRPHDSTNIGVTYGSYSQDLRREQRVAHIPTQNFETVIELNHWFQINPWFTFVPDIQYIIKPKGFDDVQNALVLGFQASWQF